MTLGRRPRPPALGRSKLDRGSGVGPFEMLPDDVDFHALRIDLREDFSFSGIDGICGGDGGRGEYRVAVGVRRMGYGDS